MKNKKWLIIGIIIVILLIIVGVITNYIDNGRVRTNHEPKFCIKTISSDGSKVTYWGLGYKVIRYVGISPNEPYESNIGVKMGSWFMKYELPKDTKMNIEYEGKTVTITEYKDIEKIENILANSKYNNEICNGINTHKITLNNEVYYIKEYCKEIQKGNKQAKITDEDLNTINNIISNILKNNEKNKENIEWNEITEEGVNEELLYQNTDTKDLEKIATLLQSLSTEIAQKEQEDINFYLSAGWYKYILDSQQFNEVINMGNDAIKSLYLIIYKSPNQGSYEYICAMALSKLVDFDNITDSWSTSKEFLEKFNQEVISNREI